MNARELLYIKTIAETKSISKSAKKLFIAQPSLSQALQKIEDNIGTPLFVRHKNGMRLTLAGEKYYKAAIEILNIYNDFKNEITYINDLKKGKVNIGIPNFMGCYLLPRIMPQFIKDYPNIEIYIREKNTMILEGNLLDCTIDFAITHTHPLRQNKCIDYEILFKDYFVLVTKKNHPISKYKIQKRDLQYPSIDIQTINNENYIMVDKNKGIRHITDIVLNDAGIDPKILLTTENYETARRLASIGYGITMIPSNYINIFKEPYDADYYFIENSDNAYWNTCIATNPNMYQSRVAKVFIDLIREYYKTSQPI